MLFQQLGIISLVVVDDVDSAGLDNLTPAATYFFKSVRLVKTVVYNGPIPGNAKVSV